MSSSAVLSLIDITLLKQSSPWGSTFHRLMEIRHGFEMECISSTSTDMLLDHREGHTNESKKKKWKNLHNRTTNPEELVVASPSSSTRSNYMDHHEEFDEKSIDYDKFRY